MQQKKIIISLRAFSKDELKAFDSFIRSPYFNKNQRLITLWDYLHRFAPDFDSPKLISKAAHKHLFEETDFQEKRLDRLLLKLYKLAEEFIAHQTVRQQPEVSHTFLLNWYDKKKLHRHFEQEAKSFDDWLKLHDPQASRFEHARFHLEKAQSNFLHRQKQYARSDVNLESAMTALDHYYLVEKLMMATAMYNRQSVLPVSYTPAFLSTIEEKLNEDPAAFSSSVRLWYKAFCLVRASDAAQLYFELKEELFSNFDMVGEHDGASLFFILQNSLTKAVSQQSASYFPELFDLYNIQIEKGWVFSDDGSVLVNVFKNIVTVGTTLGKLDWTRRFIKEHASYLRVEQKDDMLDYSHAMIAFEEKQYDEVLRLLAPLSRTNIFFDLSIRRLILKVYYERNEEESLISGISTYRVFLHRLDRIADYFKDANIAYLNILSAMSRLHFSGSDFQKRKALKTEIDETGLLPERVWLLSKVGEL